MPENTFSLTLSRVEDLQFQVSFDWDNIPLLTLDEPEPIGHRKGPNAARLLGAAVGNCLSASLLFCLQKSRVPVKGITTTVNGSIVRKEGGRLRVGRLDVSMMLDAPGVERDRLARCLEVFEDYCIVTASVRKGIDVDVVVTDAEGNVLHHQAPAPRPAEESR